MAQTHERIATGARLRRIADTLLGMVSSRLELLSVEAQEEVLRITQILFNALLAVLCLSFGVLFLAVFFTVLFWDEHRLLALGLGTAGFLAVGILAATRTAAAVRAGSQLFAASLAELRQDRQALQPTQEEQP